KKWRHGARPIHHERHRREAWRANLGRQRSRHWFDVFLHASARVKSDEPGWRHVRPATAKRRRTLRSVTDDPTDSRAFNSYSNTRWTAVPCAHVRKIGTGWDVDWLVGICAG